MIISTQNRATLLGRVMALGFLLATLLAMLLSAAPADAAAPSGKAFGWGYNSYGQLGNGTDTPRNTPGPVSNLSNVKAIATDSNAEHVLAVLRDGTVRGWGDNAYGALGDGTNSNDRLTPVVVGNLSNVAGIATGEYHSLALMNNGTVKSWGYNESGQLGNGTSGNYSDTPGDVFGLSNVRSIAGGDDHSLAVLKSGKARSWGYNVYGQLGIGSTANSINVPVPVKNLSNVKNIDGGESFTLAATE